MGLIYLLGEKWKKLTWDYVEPLRIDLKEYEQKYNIKLPDDFVFCITKYNAGMAEWNKSTEFKFDLENKKGEIFGGFISFNFEQKNGEGFLVCDIIKEFEFYKDSKLIALPFGSAVDGYLCLKDNKIYYWDEEKEKFFYVCETLTDFLFILY